VDDLTSLDVQLGPLPGSHTAIAVAKLLESGNCPSIHSITLKRNGIGNRGAIALSKALTYTLRSGVVHRLDLRQNSIGDKGAVALAKFYVALEDSALEELHLSSGNSEFGISTAAALAEAINGGGSPHLLGLSLAPNYLELEDPEVVAPLVEALERRWGEEGLRQHAPSVEWSCSRAYRDRCFLEKE
jgi:hypothetical protein